VLAGSTIRLCSSPIRPGTLRTVSQPDLFVVCKNCGSEVSPYVTECPYCGQRVRKRAPKLDRGVPTERRPRRRRPRLPKLRADEIEGIAPEVRPWATILLVVASLATTLVYAADQNLDLGLLGTIDVDLGADEVWRWFAAPFVHLNALGYQFVALAAVALFGSMLERRFGPVPVVMLFLASGGAGSALAVALDVPPLFTSQSGAIVAGANGAALGLLVAWLVDDRLAARRGDERGSDMLGVYVAAAVLVLLSVAVDEANIAAAAGGALAGAVLAPALPLFTRQAAY
jgi:membrane associated rhomboid family serine protease